MPTEFAAIENINTAFPQNKAKTSSSNLPPSPCSTFYYLYFTVAMQMILPLKYCYQVILR